MSNRYFVIKGYFELLTGEKWKFVSDEPMEHRKIWLL